MHHDVAFGRAHQRSLAQPVDELHPIGSSEHILECVVRPRALEAFVLGDEVQIMVAEHDHRAFAERAHEAQHFKRPGPAIYQVADEPQAVSLAEVELGE